MDAVDVLMEARAYIEKGWCQEAFAVDAHGREVSSHSDVAQRWCVIGAIKAGADQRARLVTEAASLMQAGTRCVSIGNWNDKRGRTQEEVLEAFDRAIGLGLERAGER